MKMTWFDWLMLVILVVLAVWAVYAVWFAGERDRKLIAKLLTVTAAYVAYFIKKIRQRQK